MLYTAVNMNNKLNVPDEVIPGRNYSFWADMKVNSWLLVAALATVAGDKWFYHHKDCPFWLRVIIALMPLPASLLWVRSIARWISGMDELHRRITLEVALFATTWTIIVIAVWLRLQQAGILEAIFGQTAVRFEKGSLTGYYALTLAPLFFFYFLGHSIFNRRYK